MLIRGPGPIPTRGKFLKFYNHNLYNIARSDRTGFLTENRYACIIRKNIHRQLIETWRYLITSKPCDLWQSCSIMSLMMSFVSLIMLFVS